MEMEEHPPSWGKPAKLPIVLCERPLSHRRCMAGVGTVWCERSVHTVVCSQVYKCCTTGHIPRNPHYLTLQPLKRVSYLLS